ncbi:hypothetical protein ABB55_25275 [Prosthecomicrobium hirschii]|uniref:Uncharacterized protein n=1 Tax=Prosthecodimorpha hirschii TaxID=665126 RepID=A0A0P6VV51_9HYPH|nr:hypothetical protein [Prosthecomicrobium hirschii]KPL55133.1 hypothetical protein ABB55_25275 [Prosthecomicrobium hirschii]
MRFLLKLVAWLVGLAALAGLAFLAFASFVLRDLFKGWEPAPTAWSDEAEVPAAFAGPVPAAFGTPVAPKCPAGGFRPVRGPNPTGALFLTVFMPWYGIPALFSRDELLNAPRGTITIRAIDPRDGAVAGTAQVAAIRDPEDRFLEQVPSGTPMTLPAGAYRFRVALGTQPMRWGEAAATVTEGGKAEVTIPLDRIAPAIEPIPVDGAPPAASRIRLAWSNPAAPDGLAVMARVGARGGDPRKAEALGVRREVHLEASARPGRHIASYLSCAPILRVARWVVEVGPSDARIGLPERIRGGDSLKLPVTGSFARSATWGVREAEGDRRNVASGFVDAGKTIDFVAPLSGGRFRLEIDGDDGPLAEATLEVAPTAVRVIGPASARFREPVELGWASEVPAALQLELRPFEPAGWPGFRPTDTVTKPGPTRALWRLPPGRSQLRLVHVGQADLPVAELVIEVTDGPAFVAPPRTVRPGAWLDLTVSLPAADGDRIAIVRRGYTTLSDVAVATLAARARTARLQAPDEPGDYDLVYVPVEAIIKNSDPAMPIRHGFTVSPASP